MKKNPGIQDLNIIADQLQNNEYSGDDEMLEFLVSETGLGTEPLTTLIQIERHKFLSGEYLRQTLEEDYLVLLSYFSKS